MTEEDPQIGQIGRFESTIYDPRVLLYTGIPKYKKSAGLICFHSPPKNSAQEHKVE